MLSMLSRCVAVIVILAALGWYGLEAAGSGEVRHYASPQGSDGSDGSLNRPWRTLGHAVGVLSPGDVLYLRGGTYYEHDILVDASGTASAPITIRSYPGERAIIDGGVPFFREAPNTEWELVDAEIQLYRSLRAFSEDLVRAWLVDDDVQLVEYDSAQNLESTNYGPLNGLEPLYMGPGLQLREDGHLYIRLVYNPNDLTDASGNPIAPKPSDPNPNHNRLAVFFSQRLFLVDGASHLSVIDVDLVHSKHIIEVRSGSQGVTLSGCRLHYGSRGLLVRENVQNWEIRDCEFSSGLPDYVYWTDVKNRDGDVAEAYPEFQSTAIDGALPGFWIHHNVFRNGFDALRLEDGTSHARVTHNVFRDLLDDAINLSKGIDNVEVSHNMLWHVMGGIANIGSAHDPGPVYIHHNVIDNSAYRRGGRPGNYREDNWPAWRIGNPFPGHDDDNKESWWRLYNNTIVSRQDPGHQWSPAGPDEVTGNPEKYVLNNIFFTFDGRVILRDDLAALGSHYDGNVFHRETAGRWPLFVAFGDGGDHDSLADFRAHSGTDWEVRGLEIDPGLDLDAIGDPTFDPTRVWDRYRPSHPQVATLGASYAGYDWPETQGVYYRGAVPPPEGFAVLLPLIRRTGR